MSHGITKKQKKRLTAITSDRSKRKRHRSNENNIDVCQNFWQKARYGLHIVPSQRWGRGRNVSIL